MSLSIRIRIFQKISGQFLYKTRDIQKISKDIQTISKDIRQFSHRNKRYPVWIMISSADRDIPLLYLTNND